MTRTKKVGAKGKENSQPERGKKEVKYRKTNKKKEKEKEKRKAKGGNKEEG